MNKKTRKNKQQLRINSICPICHSRRYENDETQRESTETEVFILCTIHFLSHENHAAYTAVTGLHIPAQEPRVWEHAKKTGSVNNVQEVTCRVTQVLESRASTCRLLLLTSYCTINVSMGGANSSPYTGNLKNPHEVAILSWDSSAELYLEIGLKDFVPTMYWH